MRGSAEVPEVDVRSLPGDGFLLDVREDEEWVAGHVDSAVHIGMGQLLEQIDEVPRDRAVAVICRSGGRSAQVVRYLRASGYDAVNVLGGMQAWQAAGLPFVSDDGTPPRVI
jgi:rhodanese-related sulfurtransferase